MSIRNVADIKKLDNYVNANNVKDITVIGLSSLYI